MCPFRDDAATVTLHTVQLTLACFLSLKVAPSLVDLHLQATSLQFHLMYPGVHTRAFVLSRFVSSPIRRNIATDTAKASCTHMWSFPPTLLPSA